MPDAPTPASETARLETVRALKILDTDPEESFDRLAQLATTIFAVPIAHVSLIDEHREWFKAKCGVSAAEGERRTAFCAHTILSDDPLIVEDTHLDERFRDNPKVTDDPAILFYAGVPLKTRSGLVVGALCIKDYKPRSFPQDRVQILQQLAEIVVEGMEHRLVEAELRKWEYVFNRAEWGISIVDGDNPTLDVLNASFAKMHGYTVDELAGRPIEDIFAPQCKKEAARQTRIVLERGHSIYENEHLRKDGSTFPVQVDATAVRDRKGKLLYRAAHVQDITERKRIEEELRFKNTILSTEQETSPDGILVVDQQGAIISYNRRFADMWGIPNDVLATESDDRALRFVRDKLVDPGRFLARVKYLYDHPAETDSDVIHLKDGRVFDRYSAAMKGNGENYGRVWYFRDVTDRVRAERSLRESEQRLARILESAMDAIVTVDEEGRISLFNAAAEDLFRCSANDVIGQPFDRFASKPFEKLLENCKTAFRRKGARKRYVWAPEGLTAVRSDGEEFSVEATISQVDIAEGKYFTIILRDVHERLEAERRLQELQLENVYLQEEVKNELGFEQIIGRSTAIQQVLLASKQVAATESTVLLTGETGTGKELIARAIHKLSGRSGKMLVKVNCAALPAGLIESELFGHEKGSFTGALTRRMGRFELANGGTIFLDEIGDLPLELQAKLLRVLQEGELERVGGTQTLRVDVRVIAATNRDLAEEVEQQRFRPDLYYRLNVFPIRLPPLREHPEDIPALVHYFTMKHGTKLGKKVETIPQRVLGALSTYHWPGNVRELQNVIERALILSQGTHLDLGGWFARKRNGLQVTGFSTLEEAEREHVVQALERTKWRVSGDLGAAKILGMKRTTLEARMKKLGIKRPC